MRLLIAFLALLLLLALTPDTAASDLNFTGIYTARIDDESITVKMVQNKDGTVTGTMVDEDGTTTFSGKVQNGRVVATAKSPTAPDPVSLEFHWENGKLIGVAKIPGAPAQTMTFTPTSAAGEAKPSPSSAPPAAGNGAPSGAAKTTGNGAVRVNGVALTPEALNRIVQKYGTRIPPGSYWYDKASGGWGLQGSPTLGFTLAGLDLGGPLRADASNGHTGVFINGRELPTADVNALLALGIPVQRGRVWCDASGNVGAEGSRVVLINLVERYNAVMAAKRPKGFYHAGAGGYMGSDGQTTYFFDPKGGSAISGP